MNVWIVSVGEPLPTDGEQVRLRRMGNLADCIAGDKSNHIEWFSVSFDHYKKSQRVQCYTKISLQNNYIMHLVYVNGYKKNVSFKRVLHHKSAGRKIRKCMENTQLKPDVIIASMEPLEVARAAVSYGKKHNIPVVVDVRDLWPEIYYEVIPPKMHFLLSPYIWLCRLTLKTIMRGAFSIVGLSDDFLGYGLRFAGRSKNSTDRVFPIAYPNYDYSLHKEDFAECWNKFGLKEGDFIVSFLGNFGKQFNFEPILDAGIVLKNEKNVKFVMCGTGLQLDTIKARATEQFVFPGWIEKKEIMSLLSHTDIGLAPYIDSMNYRLNTPNKFGEYLSASLPILVGVDGCMETLLNEYECGRRYVDGNDLASSILYYFKKNERRKAASENARKLYERQFNGDTAYQKMLDYLIEIKNVYNERGG